MTTATMNFIANNSPEYAGYVQISCTRAGRKVPYTRIAQRGSSLDTLIHTMMTPPYTQHTYATYATRSCHAQVSLPCLYLSGRYRPTVTAQYVSTSIHCVTVGDQRHQGSKASRVRGRPLTAIDSLLSLAHPSFEDCQKLSAAENQRNLKEVKLLGCH